MFKLLTPGWRSSALKVALLGIVLLIYTQISVADEATTNRESTIAVIYPDIGEPYRTVFSQIVAGIKDKAHLPIFEYPIGSNPDIYALNNALRQQNIRVVIALGRQGMKLAGNLDGRLGVVVGGVISSPESELRNMSLHSLSPDPALLFSELKRLLPTVRRVFTVYDPHQNEWLIGLAKQAARNQGLELVAYEAQDLRSAMRFYQDIFAAADSRQDALWLLQDSTTVEESSVLPLVLQESWNRSLTVFSSNFGHVRRGVLFSLYPDNTELGRHLAETALTFLASGDYREHGMVLLREVLTAINLRAAKHLGINSSQLHDFDTVFPDE